MMNNSKKEIHIYTDGSCNPEYKIGGWAAIVLLPEQEMLLQGKETMATHNSMELLSVIKALEYIENQNLAQYAVIIYSDSQYVVKIIERKEKLKAARFLNRKGNTIQNKNYVEKIVHYIETMNVAFEKVKAHQKKTGGRNYNRDVDRISRKIVREHVSKNCID